jgi:hypothetical protein
VFKAPGAGNSSGGGGYGGGGSGSTGGSPTTGSVGGANSGCGSDCGVGGPYTPAAGAGNGPHSGFTEYNDLPINARLVLELRFYDKNTGNIILLIPPGYKAIPNPIGQGTLYVPPGYTGGNANVIREVPGSAPSAILNGYTDGYIRAYNGASQPINVYTGRTGTNAETHLPLVAPPISRPGN